MTHDPPSNENSTGIIPHVSSDMPEQIVLLNSTARQCYNMGVAHGMAQAASAIASQSAKRARIYAASFEQFLAEIRPGENG